MNKTGIKKWEQLFLILLGMILLFPIVITITSSFMSKNEIASHYQTTPTIIEERKGKNRYMKPVVIPEKISFSQYKNVLFYQPSFMMLLKNSFSITIPVVIGSIIVSLFTAFGFTIWEHKYKNVVYFLYIIVMIMPLQATTVPNYIMIQKLSLDNSLLAIILPGVFSPFGTFIMGQQMKHIPKEYIEAALMEGATYWQIFIKVVLPQMKSAIATVGILVFVEYWNVVEPVIIFIKDYLKEPLSVYLSTIQSGNLEVFFAISTLFMFLPIWFLIMGQPYIEAGIEQSGIK